MATSYFDRLRKGMDVPERSVESRKWFQDKVRSLKGNINAAQFLKDPHFVRKTTFRIGFMYHFLYDPKYKEALPYWDRFPLIIAVGPAQDGFYGINLHYIHPVARARMMDRLYDTVNNEKWDETTRMRINYNILSSISSLRYFRPAFKHYLFDHIESRIMMVPSSEWEIAMYLPTEKFRGAPATKVWRETKKAVTGYRA